MAEKEMRNFALRDENGNEINVFTGRSPCQAALKPANRGHTDIKLRERGTKKLNIFTGERVQVDKPKGAPTWMPDKIWKPMVKKVGVEKLGVALSPAFSVFEAEDLVKGGRPADGEESACLSPPPAPFSPPSTFPPWSYPSPSVPGPPSKSHCISYVTKQ